MKKLIFICSLLFCFKAFAWGDSNAEFSFPTNDGTANQVLVTDGDGSVTWQDQSGGGASPLTTKGDLYTYTTEDARLAAGTNTYLLSANSATSTGLEWIDPATVGVTDHGALSGLSDDDHTQYALLGGRSGGQILKGGSGASENLSFWTNATGTVGSYYFTDLTDNGFVKTSGGTGLLSIDTNTYLTAEVDGSVSNEINTITGDDSNATSGLGITLAGAGIAATSVAGDVVTVTATEVDGSVTNEINTITTPDANVTEGLAITFADTGIMTITESGDTITFDATEVDGDPTNEYPVAGNDIDVSTATVSIESELNYVQTMTRDSGDLTLSTTTSGDIVLSPADNVGIGTSVPIMPISLTGIGNIGVGILSNAAVTDAGTGTAWDVNDAQTQHFLFEDNAANTTITDNESTTNGTADTNTSNLSVVGKINNGFDLDSTECLNTNLAPENSSDQTYSFWVKSENANETSTIFFGAYNSTARFYLGFNSSQNLGFALGNSSYETTTSTYKSTTDWVHFIVEYIKSTNTINLYKNNSLELTKSDAGAITSSAVHLGCLYSGASESNHHNGIYDDYRRFNRVLTADERAGIYNSGSGTHDNSAAAGFNDIRALLVGSNTTNYNSTNITQTNDDNGALISAGPFEAAQELFCIGTAAFSGNVTIDTDLFVADVLGGFVGINNASPAAELDVTGSVLISTDLTVGTDILDVDFALGNVGIGSTSPSAKLQVVGDAKVSTTFNAGTDVLFVESGGNVGIADLTPTYKLDITGNLRSTSGAYFATSAGNVGVGTTAPTSKLQVGGKIRTISSEYRRYYHANAGAFDPGASGATWVSASVNSLCGFQLDAVGELIEFGGLDIHSDWDGATDILAEVVFSINAAGAASTDTVDLKCLVYAKGSGETVTKIQTLEVPTTIGTAARYTQFTADFTIDYDSLTAPIEVGDHICAACNLETDTSEVDDIVVHAAAMFYKTTHTGIEEGDV